MIVCHCNVLTVEDIESAVDDLLAVDPLALITPGVLYRHLGTRGRCCGCFPLAVEVIAARVEKRRATADLEDRRRREAHYPHDRTSRGALAEAAAR